MKATGLIIGVLSLAGIALSVGVGIHASYEWDNEVASNWSLADKASTIEAKATYIERFVTALKSADLADNDALIYKTADNNCANNIEAVTTLSKRLDEIKGMDVTSFQYQQAIQQITSQEQGEASQLMQTLHGCWMKTHHYFLWNTWVNVVALISLLVGFCLSIGLLVG